jgi:hypothetical protein
MPEPKKRRARRGEPLPGPSALVLRGDLLDPEEIAASAERNYEVYGFFGISVFAEVGGTTFDDIAMTTLARARWIAVFTAEDLVAAGLELWDTDQAPHYDVVHTELAELVGRFVDTPHRIVRNEHFQSPDEGG